MIETGEIVDGKTILLLHYAKLALFAPAMAGEQVSAW